MENMTSKELKAIAKELGVKNWWNLKKTELIAEIEKIQTAEEETTAYEIDNPDNDEVTAYEVDNETEELQNAPESTEEAEVDNNEPETEKSTREVKKPNLKIKELTFNGKTQTIKEWAAELGMPWPTLYDRINRNGWTVEEALTIPLGERRKKNKEEA